MLFQYKKRYEFSKIDKAFLICLLFNAFLIVMFGITSEIRMFIPYSFILAIILGTGRNSRCTIES